MQNADDKFSSLAYNRMRPSGNILYLTRIELDVYKRNQ